MTQEKPTTTLCDGLYERRNVIKVTRTQYGLVVGINATAKAVKMALAKIPDDAKIVDVEDYTDSRASLTHNILQDASVYIFEREQLTHV